MLPIKSVAGRITYTWFIACCNGQKLKTRQMVNMSIKGSLKWRVVRWVIILPMIYALFASFYVSVTDFLDYPIATSSGVEVTKNNFYPAVTICPYANQETARTIWITKNVTTFSEAIQQSLKPRIQQSRYILT